MAKCGNCDYPLICQHCGIEFSFASQQTYDGFYDSLGPVYCPNCTQILACRYCGYTYDGGEDEYEQRRD